jgi:hypothetical protein
VFESSRRLKEEIQGLLGAVCHLAHGSYACIMEPGVILFESPEEPEGREIMKLRRLLEVGGAAIFKLPAQMAEESGPGPESDPFEGWEQDDLLLVFVNGRVALAIVCPDAEGPREDLMKPLRALVDRLLRYKETYRFDPKGRGLFVGRPKLDFVTIAKA